MSPPKQPYMTLGSPPRRAARTAQVDAPESAGDPQQEPPAEIRPRPGAGARGRDSGRRRVVPYVEAVTEPPPAVEQTASDPGLVGFFHRLAPAIRQQALRGHRSRVRPHLNNGITLTISDCLKQARVSLHSPDWVNILSSGGSLPFLQ